MIKLRAPKNWVMLEACREIYVENLLLQIKQFSKAQNKKNSIVSPLQSP